MGFPSLGEPRGNRLPPRLSREDKRTPADTQRTTSQSPGHILALWWLWCGFGVALVWPWYGFRVALYSGVYA